MRWDGSGRLRRPTIWSEEGFYDERRSHLHDLGSLMPGCVWVVAGIRTFVAQTSTVNPYARHPVDSAGITIQDFTGLVETPINRPEGYNFNCEERQLQYRV
jgi:hypothetical protein